MDEPKKRGRGRPSSTPDAVRMREQRARRSISRADRAVQISEYSAREIRARIDTHGVIRRLEQCLDGTVELSPSQVRAAAILLDRTLPVLSSQELHHHDETAALSEPELLARLRSLLDALPADARAAIASAMPGDSLTH